MADFTLTDEKYFASKNPEVATLHTLTRPDGLPNMDERIGAARDLVNRGLVVDWPIDIWGWSPSLVMGARQKYGYKWAPAAFQPDPPLADLADLSKAYPNSIRVSTDEADYPPFTPPPPPAPVSASPIGPKNGDAYSVNIPNASLNGKFLFQDGQIYTENGVKYQFHNVPGMFGAMVSWTVVN